VSRAVSRARDLSAELRRAWWIHPVIAALLTALSGPFVLGRALWLELLANLLVSICIGGCTTAVYVVLLAGRLEACQRWIRPVIHGLAIACGVALGTEIAIRILAALVHGYPIDRVRVGIWRIGGAVAAVVVVVSLAWDRLRERVRAVELREQRAQEELLRARLRNLQDRLNPHFLFNSLNTVAALVEEDPPRAVEAIERLSELLRHALEGGARGRVPLSDELRAIEAYLEIERLRFDDRLRAEVEADPSLLDLQVPPLLLQPLVENAVKHGISRAPKGGEIRIRIAREDGGVALSVSDDAQAVGLATSGTRLGHDLVRRRLELTYGAAARFHAGPEPGGGYRVDLWLPTAALAEVSA
jgi:two-component system sensor histidine kinase AlgZ